MEEVLKYIGLFVQMFGGVGALLIGMNMMSESMSRLAHGKLRNMLNKTANNRFAGVGIGATVTAIIQSSAATTVMVVGLVNAGIMTLFQATAIIMGANIGTTVTAWIASFSAFDFTSYLFLLAVIGVFMDMLSQKEIVKIIGNILAGLGLIFIGLEFMSTAIKDPLISTTISDILQVIDNPFLLLVIGALITALIQSSSAVTSIIIAFAVQGIMIGGSGDGTYFVVIGSNIGTCITALISSIGASENAKRAALVHLLFNCFGAIVFTVFLLLWSISGTSFSEVVLQPLFPGYPVFQVSTFHTLFNVVCTCLFAPFIKGFVWIAEHLIPEKKVQVQEDEFTAGLDERLLRQPSLALDHIYKSAGKMLGLSVETLKLAFDAFLKKDMSAQEKVHENNERLAKVNRQMVSHLVKISASSLVMEDEKTVSTLHYTLNDILRIGELADNVTKYTKHYVNDELVFSNEFLTMISEMFGKIEKLYELSNEVYLNKDVARLAELDAMEDAIDKDRRRLVTTHIERLNEGKCQPQNSSVFINLVGNLERAADHITYIAHSIEQNN